jgi:hypothetical protein
LNFFLFILAFGHENEQQQQQFSWETREMFQVEIVFISRAHETTIKGKKKLSPCA